MWSSRFLWRDPSKRCLVNSSASTMHAYFVLHFFSTLLVSLYLSRWVLQGIAAGIGTSNLLRAFFMSCLNSWSSGSMKWMPYNFLALSSFGFSIAHFLLFFAFRCIRHECLVWRSFVFLSVSHRTMKIQTVVFHPIRWILWNLSTYLIILDLHQHSNNRRYFSPALHPKMFLLLWWRQCIAVELGMILLSARTVWLFRRSVLKWWWRPVWFSWKISSFFSSV